MKQTEIKINKNVVFSNSNPVVIIAGPCVIESRKHALGLAQKLKSICQNLNVKYVFKASYDKANRSSGSSFRGPGIEEGLDILSEIKSKLGLPVLTDVHTEEQAVLAAKVADIIQVPAFLSRQTDLIEACAKTGKPVNVKKGQFMAPEDTLQVIKKAVSFGNKKVLLTERGVSFGYRNLVVDFRSIEIMKNFGAPVIFDATHSVQRPGGLGTSSGGNREFVFPLSKAAAAVGIAGLFLEVHENPEKAFSDGPNSLNLKMFKSVISKIKQIDRLVK
ncbi:MAG: 3-deoxy-8-phosphooctulonate synthase [Elusimicrobia bacterium]|nr:3-deoxy-8-phosphooctulonate synthase [Elusimicrobiota bacterium]